MSVAGEYLPRDVLVPILATQLLAELHEGLRKLGRQRQKGRGQPPKRQLAAAQVLCQLQPADAYNAACELVEGPRPKSVAALTPVAADTADDAATATVNDTANDTGPLDSSTNADLVAAAVERLEEWLEEGDWVEQIEPPTLLRLIEKVLADLAADEVTSTSLPTHPIGQLLDGYRELLQWANTFREQRPPDASHRDHLVWLIAARQRLFRLDEAGPLPVRAASLLSAHAERLPEGWASQGDPGLVTLTRGHFGNDDDRFDDVCRAVLIDLLYRAAASSDPTNGTGAGARQRVIYISTTLFNRSDSWLKAEFDGQLRACLAGGWRVVHALSHDDNPSELTSPVVQADFATNMLAHLATAGVYVPVRSAPAGSSNMVLAEGIGAAVFPTVGQSLNVDTGQLTASSSPVLAVRALTGRGKDGPIATPLVSELRTEARATFPSGRSHDDAYLDKRQLTFGFHLPSDELRWFDRQLTASELLEGDRLALKSWPPTSTLPVSLSDRQFNRWLDQLIRLQQGNPDPDGLVRDWPAERVAQARRWLEEEGEASLTQRLKRLQHKRAMRHFGFETNTAEARYRDCLPKSSLVTYLTSEDCWVSPNAIYGPGGLSLEERQEHGLYLANQLELSRMINEHWVGGQRRVGYHLGLVDDESGQPYDLTRTWWLATRSTDHRANQVHFLHQTNASGRAFVATLKDQAVTAFDAVETFISVFDGIWYSIPMAERLPQTVRDLILDLLPLSVRQEFAYLDQAGRPG